MQTFQPMAWQPLPAPPVEKNEILRSAERWHLGAVGPEDVIVAADGAAIVGTETGEILRVTADSVAEIANVGGRPLGIEWFGEDILVCNAFSGLQLVSMAGAIHGLVDTYLGTALLHTNNASVAADGTVYFTDSSTRWDLDNYVTDILEGQPTGRLFKFSQGELEVVVDGLQYANGVALDADESSVFVAETSRYRIHRHWISGPSAGTTELFADNLPGFPDNLTFGDGTLWVGCASPRQGLVDMINPRPWLRKLTHRLPESLKPDAKRHGMILGLDRDGYTTHDLQDASGEVAITTSARVSDGRLYVGCLKDDFVSVLDLT